ncbi:MAG: NADP-dependent phosphogluconate dehydrogenase, partial [Spirochaetales bacterium]|nr:NADP-dependent phosphogluconate dehydrogenase [Spirochaetales bacterium]
VDKILDAAGQKGTGKWTGISALHEGVPLTLIVESVFARSVSALKEQRVEASKVFDLEIETPAFDKQQVLTQLQEALFAAKIISYAQGFDLIKTAGITNNWELDLGGIAQLWRGGCIIRSRFLGKITEAYRKNPDLANLILDSYFAEILKKNHRSLRAIVALAAQSGIPTPSMNAALSWFDSYRTERLPANLLQAQRDYFGAHTYERTDKPRGEFFHTNWTGRGGSTASTIYSI